MNIHEYQAKEILREVWHINVPNGVPVIFTLNDIDQKYSNI